jgi:hypothetical protein
MEDLTMQTRREMALKLVALAASIPLFRAGDVLADPDPASGSPGEYSPEEIINNGHRFFGSVSRGLAEIVEAATKRWGKPNGYVLGQEAGGAFIGGLRYGEGIMYTRNAGDLKVFWQGPSLGFDAGADGDRTMMLVYNLPATNAIFRRYGGVEGSAYLVGGFGMTALVNDNVFVVPIRSGLGARLGFNVSYLKFTESSTWNPF